MITTSDLFKTAVQGLQAHKIRSALTVVGVVIGVAAIMIVMAIGNSARDLIIREIEVFGSGIVVINAGSSHTNIMEAILSESLQPEDVDALRRKENVPDAVMVNAAISGSETVTYGTEAASPLIMGSDYYIFEIYKIDIISGRAFDEFDVASQAPVVVLGKDIAKDLFGLQDPIGERVKVKNKRLQVIGISSAQNASFLGLDDVVIMPYTTARQYILGIRHIQEIAIQASSPDKVNAVAEDAARTLREQHEIDDPEDDDFIINTPEDMLESINSVFDGITAFLGLVAAISLVVGGIGVMNIMLISVTERTREIGLRKALGATNRAILWQFISEAVLLTVAGGVIGIVTGLVITWIITIIASYATGISFSFIVSIWGIVLGIGVSGLIGIVFGVVPARNASRKSPMEALRYE